MFTGLQLDLQYDMINQNEKSELTISSYKDWQLSSFLTTSAYACTGTEVCEDGGDDGYSCEASTSCGDSDHDYVSCTGEENCDRWGGVSVTCDGNTTWC